MFKKKKVEKPSNVKVFGQGVAMVVAAHYVITGIDNLGSWIATKALTWRANQEAAKLQVAQAEEATQAFETAAQEETEEIRRFLESYAKAHGVVNTHAMKVETLVERCQQLRAAESQPEAASA